MICCRPAFLRYIGPSYTHCCRALCVSYFLLSYATQSSKSGMSQKHLKQIPTLRGAWEGHPNHNQTVGLYAAIKFSRNGPEPVSGVPPHKVVASPPIDSVWSVDFGSGKSLKLSL